MVNNSTNINNMNHHCLDAIVHVVDIGGIVDHHCLEAIVHVVDHHCLEVIVHVVDIGGIVNHHWLESSDGQQFHQYQQHEQSPLNSDGQQHE
jgi:hypothetical protein